MPAVILKIHGKVHGVGFRFHAMQQANKYDIKGYAKNLPDKTVEIHAQSDDKRKLDVFIRECKRGPLLSKIDKVEQKDAQPIEDAEDFEVR